jgi:hypothetical protein
MKQAQAGLLLLPISCKPARYTNLKQGPAPGLISIHKQHHMIVIRHHHISCSLYDKNLWQCQNTLIQPSRPVLVAVAVDLG